MRLLFMFIFMFNLTLIAQNTQSYETDTELFDSFEEEFDTNQTEKSDPLKSYNIVMTKYNDMFYTNIFFPVARGYSSVVSQDIRVGISNFFYNLKFPLRFVNNLAQLKLKNTLEETEGFLINSTIGMAGLFDIAQKSFKIKKHNEDFGQTLGFYGVGSGFYVVLPFFGPSNVRDTFGLIFDTTFDPTIYYLDDEEMIVTKTLYYTNEASFKSKEYELLKQDAVELYPQLQDFYEQHRESEIKK